MFLREPKKLLDAVTAPTTSAALHDPQWRHLDEKRDEVTLWVHGTAVTSFSLQPQQSLDGQTWFALGAAITAEGLATVTGITLPFFRVDLTAFTGTDITVEAA